MPTPENERRPEQQLGAAEVTCGGVGPSIAAAVDNITRTQRQLIVDVLLEAWPRTWKRRALALEAARPMPGDFTGSASREELSAQWQRLTEAANACRARAQASPHPLIEDVVDEELGGRS